jgi:hypothetical protein
MSMWVRQFDLHNIADTFADISKSGEIQCHWVIT